MELPARILGPMPFARLSATHACCNAADSFFAVSLAGSLFFNVSVDAARPRIIAYLLVTLVPFLFLAPIIGPLIDRFARTERVVAAATLMGRGILCLFVAGDIRNLLLYPEVFAILVLDKSYAVTKSALVPRLVEDDSDLVAANSRLARIATVVSLVSGAIAIGVLNATAAEQVLRVAALLYFGATALALRIPSQAAQPLPEPEVERDELRTPTVRAAATAMGLLRAATGFLVFVVAFGLKRDAAPLWFFGVVAAASIAGGFTGTVVSPLLRTRFQRVEPLFLVALVLAGAMSALAAASNSRPGQVAAVFAVALGASIARQSFDSVLQRDAPDAARGRAFARFETLFQLVWVIGALLAVIVQPSLDGGFVALGAGCLLTALGFGVYLRRYGGQDAAVTRRTRTG
ncbi:MAG: MFS transporter [Acidimicrobiia bacterium]